MGRTVHRIIERDLVAKTGICKHCGPVKLRIRNGGKRATCNNSEKRWSGKLFVFKEIGMTREEFLALVEERKGLCEICGTFKGDELCVDHNHQTKQFRGLLCRNCNWKLGFFGETPEILEHVIQYLTKVCK